MNTPQWVKDAQFYHIYPLGLCDAPHRNDFTSAPVSRLDRVHEWLDHIAGLGVNAVYIGPLWESTTHGYDTADYFRVDRRLGTTETLQALIGAMKAHGMRVIFDAVLNHTGRDFWAFKDVQANGQSSPYAAWIQGIDFSRQSRYGDSFAYEGWAGHYSLVKLNLHHPAVREHLFAAVTHWVNTFDIDGLRIDAADVMAHEFLCDLAAHGRTLKPDFWLMGEVVHGDYRHWANAEKLYATTNYECYKGLYSSLVDKNYFEIAYALSRQSGAQGIYRDLWLYNFVDNHDVNRVASNLKQAGHLYPLYLLLYTMPGVPSLYYGSEWGISGARTDTSDRALRPALDFARDTPTLPQQALPGAIQRFAALRHQEIALREGDYVERFVAPEQFAFSRQWGDEMIVVVLNAAQAEATIMLNGLTGKVLVDVLNNGERFSLQNGSAKLPVYPHWGRVLRVERS